MRERSTAEWRALLDAADVPNMPMASPEDLLADPHHAATGFVREIEHPSEGRLRTTANPTQWSATPPGREASAAPQLGQHTLQVLREAGLGEAQIAALQANGGCMQASSSNDQRETDICPAI